MPAKSLRCAIVLIIVVALLTAVQSSRAPAQQSNDLETLRQQINQSDQAGKYAEALALQRKLAAEIEKADTANVGKPGAKTASGLADIAWFALLAHNFKESLAAGNRAHALAPGNLFIESNRAHALLFLGHVREARAIYLAYKNKPMSMTSTYIWQDGIAGDVDAFKKAGLEYVAVAKIVRELGGEAGQSGQALRAIAEEVEKLERAGRLNDALPLAQQYVALTRQRYGEDHAAFATAIGWLGQIYYDKKNYLEAEPLFLRELAIDKKALGPDHLNVGVVLNRLAELYRAQDRSAEAEPLFKRALAIDETALGPEHPDVRRDLNKLAKFYQDEHRFDEAVPLYMRAIAIAEKVLGPEHPEVRKELSNLALLYQGSGGHAAELESLYRRVIAIDLKAHGPDHPDVGKDFSNLAQLYRVLGRDGEAEWYIGREMEIMEKTFGLDSVGLLGQAMWYTARGRYTEAEQLYQRAIAIAQKVLGPDHPDFGTDLTNLAFVVYQAQGRYAEAEPLLKRALTIHETAHGPFHPDVGTDLVALAGLYQAQGRYGGAEPLFKRALEIDEKARGPDHPDVGRDLNNLAALYFTEGRHGDAEPLFKRALAIDENARGPDHPDVGRDLNNLAVLYQAQGRNAEAEPLFERALTIGEKTYSPDHPIGTELINNLAVLNKDQGRYAAAAGLFMQALRKDTRTLGAEHPNVARDLNNYAVLNQEQGHYDSAERQYKRALEIDEKAFGPDHPNFGRDLNSLAALYFSQSDWARAVDYWRRGTSVITHRAQRGTFVGEALTGPRKSEAAQLSSQFSGLVKAAYRLAGEQHDDALARDMFQTAQWAQSSEAAASLAQMAARSAKDDPKLAVLVRERQDLVAEWQRRDQVRSAAVAQTSENRSRQVEAANSARITAIDMRIVTIDHELAAKFPDYAALASPAPLSVEDVQKQLDADEALVLFLDTPESDRTSEETFIWAVTRTDIRWMRSELGTRALTHEVAALRCGLDYEGSWSAKDSRCPDLLKVAYGALDHRRGKLLPFDLARAHEIYKGLFGQIEDLIKNKRLLIAPSGPLTQLPFQVLVTERPKTARPTGAAEYRDVAWLVRKHAITVLPAVSSLKALRELAKASHASEAYVGFGDPLLDGEPTKYPDDDERAKLAREKRCESTSPQRESSLFGSRGGRRAMTRSDDGIVNLADIRIWAPLPETADELCDVVHDFGVDPKTHLFLGATATETKVKQLSEDGSLAKYKIVHFATHGAVAGQVSRATEPGLLLTPPEQASETDDGYLSASEIAGLKLDADWVILSACNTAAGGAQGAEALSGLARAFFYAGARSLLVSHWEVASEPTVKLITKAIAELKADPGIGRAEALRRSLLSMIDTGKEYEAHPAFWAPFVLVGEGGAAR